MKIINTLGVLTQSRDNLQCEPIKQTLFVIRLKGAKASILSTALFSQLLLFLFHMIIYTAVLPVWYPKHRSFSKALAPGRDMASFPGNLHTQRGYREADRHLHGV